MLHPHILLESKRKRYHKKKIYIEWSEFGLEVLQERDHAEDISVML